MPRVKDVCRHIRSKNAGPFWVTFDLFFNSQDMFEKHKDDPALGPQLFAETFGTDPELVRYFPVPTLGMMKISYPRPSPQGGKTERDMHSGQQFVRILDVELAH